MIHFAISNLLSKSGKEVYCNIQKNPGLVINKMVAGASEIHKKVILEALWMHIAAAGYKEVLYEITRRLEPTSGQLSRMAYVLSDHRPLMVYSFCKEFGIDPVKPIERLIEIFKNEEIRGFDFNSRRFLSTLEEDLEECRSESTGP